MTLVSSIISDAYRESNMLALGKLPTSDQTVEALRLYNAMIVSLYGGTAGERLRDWPLGIFGRDPENCDYLLPYTEEKLQRPELNSRLIAVNPNAMRVWFSVEPQDGARMSIADPFTRLAAVPVTLDGNGRTIEGLPELLLDVSGTFREWLYRADLAAWLRISDLLATDENPFPAAYDMMFTIMLSMRLNPRYGREMSPQSAEMLKLNRREFVARYVQSRPLTFNDSISWPFMSTQGYDTQRSFSSSHGFYHGTYWTV